jgi:hypothetical protein
MPKMLYSLLVFACLMMFSGVTPETARAECMPAETVCDWMEDWDEEDPFGFDDPYHCYYGCDPEATNPSGEWDWVGGPFPVENAHQSLQTAHTYGSGHHTCCLGDPESCGEIEGGGLLAALGLVPPPVRGLLAVAPADGLEFTF